MFWKRLKQKWARHEQEVAERELRREAAEPRGSVPHTGGALYDEPFQSTETVPGDDAPGAGIQ
jgi:hypothetical protein